MKCIHTSCTGNPAIIRSHASSQASVRPPDCARRHHRPYTIAYGQDVQHKQLLQPVLAAGSNESVASMPDQTPLAVAKQPSRQSPVHPSQSSTHTLHQLENDQTLQQELAVQEQEVDLSVDDLLQLQYEVPTDSQLDQQDAEEGIPVTSSQGSQTANQQADEDSDAQLSRKGAILLEIIAAAGSSDLDTKIAQFIDDIDEELLQLLELRIQAVSQVSRPAAEQLRELYGVLNVVYERASTTPALRLLDDVLDILGDDMSDSQAYAGKRLEALSRLKEAFSGGASTGVDIFAAAAALAEAGPVAAAELASEAVDPFAFLSETTGVLEDAKAAQAQLAADLERAQRELAYLKKHKPDMLQGPQAKQHLAQLTRARQVHATRAVTLSQLQDVLSLAQQASSSSFAPGEEDDL